MKNLLSILILFGPILLMGQDNFIGSYSDHSWKVDDYIYIGKDTLVVSSTEAYQLEKSKISISKTSFGIDDGGMGFKSKKVSSEPTGTDESSSYSIVGPYGDKWNVLKANIGEESVIAVFHARQEMQPVINYSVFATHQITKEELTKFILSYLTIERENINEYHLIEVDKYDIGDIPQVKAFVKKVMYN